MRQIGFVESERVLDAAHTTPAHVQETVARVHYALNEEILFPFSAVEVSRIVLTGKIFHGDVNAVECANTDMQRGTERSKFVEAVSKPAQSIGITERVSGH